MAKKNEYVSVPYQEIRGQGNQGSSEKKKSYKPG
jgi:hypothetical protein